MNNSIYLRDDCQAETWKDKIILSQKKAPLSIVANATAVFRLSEVWRNRLCFNDLSKNVEFEGRPWDDNFLTAVECWFQRHGLTIKREAIFNAARLVASEQSYHPIREYLKSLSWDGTNRLSSWLKKYARAKASPDEHPDYLPLVGKCWMIAAVARVFEPGCQADNALVLEGAQGLGKSTLFRVLFEPWFTDHIPSMTSKDGQIALLGNWCVLLDEMGTWGKTAHGEAKQFVSRRFEQVRLPYDKFPTEFPRQSVMAGTINNLDGYLTDPTGNRRYWPVSISGKIDITAVGAVKNQLWAEAFHLYSQGEKWYFDDEIATSSQETRIQQDIWHDAIAAYVESRNEVRSCAEVATYALNMDLGRLGQREKIRIGAVLRALGFEYAQIWDSEQQRKVKTWKRPPSITQLPFRECAHE
jgi:predicted P-loop ATPase